MTAEQIINSFEQGLLRCVGAEIRVVGAVRIGEVEQIYRIMRDNGYEPKGRPATYNDGSQLHSRFVPITSARRELISANLRNMPPGSSFADAWRFTDEFSR